MSSEDLFGWWSRAIALASLGGAALSRSVFARTNDDDPSPLQMQVLVALALQRSLNAESSAPVDDTDSGSSAIAVDGEVWEMVIEQLRAANFVEVARPDVEDELSGEDEHEGVSRVELTETGFAAVDRWLRRAARRFSAWPPENRDVDDAIG